MSDRLFAYRLPYGRLIHEDWETLEFMRDIGVDVVALSPMNTVNYAGVPYSDYPPVWQWDEDYRFDSLDRQFGDVLARHPKVRLLTVVDLNCPLWLSRRLGMDSFACVQELMFCEEWRSLTFRWLEAFLRHCEERWPGSMHGYIPACGGTLEWYNRYGIAPGVHRTLAYRGFCEEHGWPERGVPTYDRILGSRHGFVRDPKDEADVIQYARYLETAEAEFIAEVVRRMRSLIPAERRIGLFLGYVHGLVCNGHSEFEHALDLAKPDFTICASCNADRTLGHTGASPVALHALRRRDIGILHEVDRITDTTDLGVTHGGGTIWERWDTPEKAVAGLRREMAMALIHGFSLWWFNIWGMSYRGAEVREALRNMAGIWRRHGRDSSGSAAEILFVYDRESNYHVDTANLGDDYPHDQIVLGHGVRRALSASAYPCDATMWDDLPHLDLAQYRLVLFQNPTVMTRERKAFLERNVLRDGRTVVWCIPPGMILDGQYTGRRLEFAPGDYAECLPDRPDDLTPERIRDLARSAGVHEYAPGCAAWASREFLMLNHAGKAESVTVTLKTQVEAVIELFSGRRIPVHGRSFKEDFPAIDTRLYHIG